MNIRVAIAQLEPVRRTATPPHRSKFNPRAEILDEVVAGLLWMTLDLPQDVSRPELEDFRASIGDAHPLRRRRECAIEGEICFSCNPISSAVPAIATPFMN